VTLLFTQGKRGLRTKDVYGIAGGCEKKEVTHLRFVVRERRAESLLGNERTEKGS